MPRTRTKPAQQQSESIIRYSVDKAAKRATVTVAPVTTTTKFDRFNKPYEEVTVDHSKKEETIMIVGDLFDSLMSGKPSWSRQKEEGTFSEDDLWLVIEAIDSGDVLEIGEITAKSKNKL